MKQINYTSSYQLQNYFKSLGYEIHTSPDPLTVLIRNSKTNLIIPIPSSGNLPNKLVQEYISRLKF